MNRLLFDGLLLVESRIVRILGFCGFALATVLSPCASAYDDSWYRVEYWGREQPSGFTVMEDASIDIRAEPDVDVARGVRCDLSQGATYHPRNESRVAKQKLQFVTFNKIEHYVVDQVYRWKAHRHSDNADTLVDFRPGDRWEYLAYGAEGYFIMRFDGELYSGFQGPEEVSTASNPMADFAARVDEWMYLKCDNGNVGWLRLRDLEGLSAFRNLGLEADKTE
jgi:hypothetical protein